jgi:mono/diheme cytochrome c family protein
LGELAAAGGLRGHAPTFDRLALIAGVGAGPLRRPRRGADTSPKGEERQRSIFGSLIVLLVALFAFALPAQAQSRGEVLYAEHGCYGCHGFDGKSRMMPLDTATSGILQDENLFITFLRMRADQNPILPSTRMPNYAEESLPDADARAIYAHIRAIQSDDPELEDIPVLKSILDAAASE